MNLILYSPNIYALLDEAKAAIPHLIVQASDGSDEIGPLTKTPLVCNGDESMAIVADPPAEVLALTGITVIGEQWWDGNGDPQITLGYGNVTAQDAQVIYDRVYPRTPTEDYTPPPIFGSVKA